MMAISTIKKEFLTEGLKRYIELNPVAARMVKTPDEYGWSSYGTNSWGRSDVLVTPHEVYLRTGSPPEDCGHFYLELFQICHSR
ncbi:MAG: hypothetical protein QNK31_12625 [Porticoccus sp.]|nr:hypothetical protein [Porticoccus sp.]